jgi:TPR repeat protein
LNPLLNPLLAENMGRWAQVYFTSPPEKREQAVQELLRELEAEKSGHAEADGAASALTRQQQPEHNISLASQASEAQSTLVRCHACGRKNLSSQKFCGMCGTHLGEDGEVAELHRDHLHSEDIEIADLPNDDEPAVFTEGREDSRFVRHEQDYYEPRLNTNELSLFQSGDGVDYGDDDVIFSTPGGSGSYRIVIGLVLAIVIGALGYMAWRSGQDTSQTSHLESVPPVAANENAPAAPAPTPAKSEAPDQTAPVENRAAPSSNQAAPPAENQATPATKEAPKPVRNEANTKADNAAPALPHGISRPPKAAPSETSTATGGGEELAVAQGYLNGTNGQGRNNSEAAKWLWKAIAKHNAEASLLLSDLYLKGEGVSKNCDQARVLLDSAVLRGVKDAGTRLRHLQAFGCQ